MMTDKEKELAKLINKINQICPKKLTAKEKEENIIEWTTFYRRNLDVFTEDYLEIPLHFFQKQLLQSWNDNEVNVDIASRGISKSFLVAILSTDLALLYSGMNILITSFTLAQSNSIIKEKIDELLTSESRGISPVLKQLRKDGYIQFKKDPNTDAQYVAFGNGSKIFAVNCGESCRGKRSNLVIVDEAVLVKKVDYYSIVEPTLEKRNFNGRPKDYKEETKQIFLTSAKTKTSWIWTLLKNTVNDHYKDKRIKKGFFAGDIFTAVANGIQTKKQYIARKRDTDDMSFEQEYLNIFLGNSENSIFKYEDFESNQILEKPFYPKNSKDILFENERKYKFSDSEIRILSCDIAVATGNENDNTVFVLMTINKETGHRKVEYIKTLSGINSMEQVLQIKRLFYDYQCSYCIIDTKGVGNAIFDILTVETEDLEFNEIYPAWTVCLERQLQISSNTVIDDKISRTQDMNAKPVIIPYAGTADLNSQMHLLMRKTLKDGDISFLKDSSEMENILQEKDKKWLLKTAEEKANLILPFENTKFLINEAVSLEVKFTEGGAIKLTEAKRTDTKDRYMALAMGNFLADKIYSKISKGSYEDEYNDSDWDFLSGDYSNFNNLNLW